MIVYDWMWLCKHIKYLLLIVTAACILFLYEMNFLYLEIVCYWNLIAKQSWSIILSKYYSTQIINLYGADKIKRESFIGNNNVCTKHTVHNQLNVNPEYKFDVILMHPKFFFYFIIILIRDKYVFIIFYSTQS